jgi:hypothetical protein
MGVPGGPTFTHWLCQKRFRAALPSHFCVSSFARLAAPVTRTVRLLIHTFVEERTTSRGNHRLGTPHRCRPETSARTRYDADPQDRHPNRVARGGVEPPTYRFSGGRSYQLSYLAKTSNYPGSVAARWFPRNVPSPRKSEELAPWGFGGLDPQHHPERPGLCFHRHMSPE